MRLAAAILLAVLAFTGCCKQCLDCRPAEKPPQKLEPERIHGGII
jgi:hypothetical protein